MPVNTINLEKFFTYEMSLKRLERLQPSAKTPIMDLIYPESKQDVYPKPMLAAEDLPSAVKNLPVIVRGSASYIMPTEKTKVKVYEPFPVEVEKEVSDARLNDLRNLTNEDVNAYIDLLVSRIKEGCKATAEALSIQSLSGTITYPVQESPGAFNDYGAAFGNTKSYTPSIMWNSATATIGSIFTDGVAMADKIDEDGFGDNVVILCGSKAFTSAVNVINAGADKGIKVTITSNKIELPGFTLIRASGKYYNYKTKTWVKGIADEKVCAVGLNAPFWFPFCSLDNAEANFQGLPFWASVRRNPNNKGYIIRGESKPFPVPIVTAICWAIVTT